MRAKTPALAILRVRTPSTCEGVAGNIRGGDAKLSELNGGEPMKGPYPTVNDGRAMDLRLVGVDTVELAPLLSGRAETPSTCT